jgi:hypothetical protein
MQKVVMELIQNHVEKNSGSIKMLNQFACREEYGQELAKHMCLRQFKRNIEETQVLINKSKSVSFGRTRGIPQGSPLGPILFNIYIDDIIDQVVEEENIFLFADYIVVVIEINDSNPDNVKDNIKKIHDGIKNSM